MPTNSGAVLTMAEICLFKIVVSEQVLEECQRNLYKKISLALPIFKQLISQINPEILPNPSQEQSAVTHHLHH